MLGHGSLLFVGLFRRFGIAIAIAAISMPSRALPVADELPGRITILVRSSKSQGYEFVRGVMSKTQATPELLVTKPPAGATANIRPGHDLMGIATSPDGRFVAYLTSTERWGLMPWELLAGLTGHPIPRVSFFVEVFDSKGNRVAAAVVVKRVAYGQGAISWQQ